MSKSKTFLTLFFKVAEYFCQTKLPSPPILFEKIKTFSWLVFENENK